MTRNGTAYLIILWLALVTFIGWRVQVRLRHDACVAGLTGRYADLSQEDKDATVRDCEAGR